jgi:hypothetical protein
MPLDTTVGGTAADSYGTLAAYEAYVVANIDTSFNGHGHDSTHELNLRRATQYIDRQNAFAGYKATSGQALSWPRITGLYVDGWPVESDVIPQDIISAQFEIAYLMETADFNPFANFEANIKRVKSKAGPVETETEYAGAKAQQRIVAVQGLLRPYTSGGSAGQVRMMRG